MAFPRVAALAVCMLLGALFSFTPTVWLRLAEGPCAGLHGHHGPQTFQTFPPRWAGSKSACSGRFSRTMTRGQVNAKITAAIGPGPRSPSLPLRPLASCRCCAAIARVFP
jgi:hypothetical protein